MDKSFKTQSFNFIDFTEMDEAMSLQVWKCRNLPEIRKWMVTDSEIPLERHSSFVQSLNAIDNRLYYSILSGGVFVGSINLTFISEHEAERGIYLHPEYIGKGLAKLICKEFYQYFRDNRQLTVITTKVKVDNQPSLMLERSLGAVQEREDGDYVYFSLKL